MGWFGEIASSVGKAVKWAAPAVLAPLTGGASLAAYGAYGASSANKQNVKMAQQQMDFQERMSNTEIQRRVADLQAAGMNPMLAAVNQQGASSAQGARTEVQSPWGPAINSALSLRMQTAQLENMNTQTRLTSELANNANIEGKIKANQLPWSAQQAEWSQGKLEAETMKVANELRQQMAQLDISRADLENKRLTNAQLEKMQPLLQRAMELENQLKHLQVPEAQVGADWYSGPMGGGGRASNAIKDIIQIIRLLGGK